MCDVSLLSLGIIKKIVHLVSCLVFLSLLLRSLYDSYSKPFKFSVQIYVKALNFSKGMRFKRLFPMLLTAYTHLPNAKVLWGAFFVSSLAILMIQRQHTIMAFHIYFLILMKKKKHTSHSLADFFLRENQIKM